MKYHYSRVEKQLSVLFACLLCCVSLSAQSEVRKIRFSGGPVTELNISKFMTSQHSGVESHMRLGVTVGGFLRMDVSRRFAVQGELLYHFKCSYIGLEGRNDIQYWGMEIPVYAVYLWHCGRGHHIYIGAGAYSEFGFCAKVWMGGKHIDLYETDNENGVSSMRDSNTGFAFMAGYEMPCGLQVNLGYKLSISNILDSNSNQFALYPMTASIGLAYRFGK